MGVARLVSAPAFPFAVEPSADDDTAEASRDDARGPDTVNRILLHGARHHDREAVFLGWGQGRKGWGWRPTPDWRADRAAIRAALVLRRRLQVAEGERVALWLPLDPAWAEIERGVWSIGAVSVPVDPAWPVARVAEVLADSEPVVLFAPSLDRVRALEAIGGRPEELRAVVPRRAPEAQGEDWLSLAKLLEYGGVQDTPERASMWRTFARSVGPDVVASIEYGEREDGESDAGPARHPARSPRAVTQGELRRWAALLTRRFPPRPDGVRLVATDRPDLAARVLTVAGWADGLTRTAFAASRVPRERASELAPELVAGRGSEAAEVLTRLRAGANGARPGGNGTGVGDVGEETDDGPLARLRRWLHRAAPTGAPRKEAWPAWFLATSGPSPAAEALPSPTGGRVEVALAREALGLTGAGEATGPVPNGLENRFEYE